MSDTQKHSLRKAVETDADALWALRTSAIMALPATAYTKDDVEAWASKPQFEGFRDVIRENFYLICELGGEVVGGGFLDLEYKSIEAMYVSPARQGRGIGRSLLTSLLDEAKRRGFDEVTLSSTLNAQPFYEAVGFETLFPSTYKFSDGRELACIEMRLRL